MAQSSEMRFGSRDERVFVCRQCGQLTAVGPCFDHIDAERFRCAQCRPVKGTRAADLADTIAKARKRQETAA